MVKITKEVYCRKRKPVIFLICEGRNKTETNYFNHFKLRDAKYNLFIKNCESTDIPNMAKKANSIFRENNIDKENGEHVFCLIDLDLDKDKFLKL